MRGPRLYAMAWRNLWRNRRRTLVTLSALVFGFLLAILLTGVSDRSLGDGVDLAARMAAGHVTLQHPEFLETPSTKRTVRDVGRLQKLAMAEPGVTGTASRITGQLMLATAGQSQAATFIAYDPRVEDIRTLPILDAILPEERLRDPDGLGIVLGAGLADRLGTKIGRKVVYTLTDRKGEIVTGLARVSGVLKTGVSGLDAAICLLPIDSMRAAVGYAPDESTFVALFLRDHRKADRIARSLAGKIGPGVSVLTWREVQPDLAAFIATKRGGLMVMGAIMLLLTAAGIFNTLFVSVMERLREFGILLAIGFSPGRLFRLVIWESLWLGLVGLLAGAAVTALPYYYLAARGIDLSRMTGGQKMDVAGAALSPILRVGIHPESAAIIAAIILLATLLSGLYPAWRAGRVVPVEAIKLV